ncbi:hypothetical protein [Paenibacillus sp. Soil522]|uniref:hypothetical protein n=1 Tax=Paenibacillus sp. Soil522 TaxID=1736388 RepID=UPI0006F40285|nr:hypothetical protein [Paenibacillus sp. Soil522]KRE31625.1 hypothetical protein ASG81_24880 [Paenibacillus sp. Soil522]
MKLSDINKQYEEILHSDLPDEEKDLAYSKLMTKMEEVYKIPYMRNEAFESKNPAVIAMYRKLSMSRTTL